MDITEQLQALLDVVRAARCLTVMNPQRGVSDPVAVGAVGWTQLQIALAVLSKAEGVAP